MKNKIALLSIFALTASMFGGVAYADDPEETETSTSSSSAPEEDSQTDNDSESDEDSQSEDSQSEDDSESDEDDEESTDDENSGAGQCVIGLDPGHNKDDVDEHDPKTGAYMSDYANGQELDDMWKMGEDMKDKLEEEGYEAVLLRGSKDENSTYRDKVDKAESSNVDMGVSLHTTPGANLSMIMTQTVGGFREGKGEDGSHKKVEFTAKETADKSQEYAEKIASVRSDIEPNPVSVKKEWSFDGREPLWAGNIPIISLIAEDTPWVYSEFGSDTGGGANGITDEELAVYTEGMIEGIKEALPADSCEGSSSKGSDDSDDDSDSSSNSDDSSRDDEEDSSKDDDKDNDKGSDKKESKPKKSTQSNDGITQWLGYYPKISIVGDVLADSITSESLVELLKKNGAQEVTKGATGDSDIMEIASDISGMNSSAIIIAVSANSYAPLVGDDVLKAEAEISNAVLEASKSPDVEKVVWISPILRSEQEGTEINEDIKAVNDLVRGVERNIKANNSPKLSFIHGGRVVGSNQEESLPNEAGARLLIMQSAGVLAAHAKKSGYEPEVSTSSSKSKDKDSSKDDDKDKGSSRDDDKDKDSSKDDDKGKDSSKDDEDSSKDDDDSTDDQESSRDDEESSDEDSKDDDDSSSTKASPPGAVTEEDWELLAQCESNGDWSINTGNGYHGGVQFAAGTWTGHGGDKYAPTADKATKEEQMEIANKVLKGQGWGAWPACTAGAASAVTSKEPAPEGTFAD